MGESAFFIGAVLIILGASMGKVIYSHAESMTRINGISQVQNLAYEISYEDCQTVDKVVYMQNHFSKPGVESHDGWMNPMRLEVKEENGVKILYIVSAGSDEKIGTDDDIIYNANKEFEEIIEKRKADPDWPGNKFR